MGIFILLRDKHFERLVGITMCASKSRGNFKIHFTRQAYSGCSKDLLKDTKLGKKKNIDWQEIYEKSRKRCQLFRSSACMFERGSFGNGFFQ